MILLIVALILSVILHEIAHGFAANAMGDPTARYAGRLSLNPLVHIDPVGSVILPTIMVLSGSPILFGWAKPVPYNAYNLRPPFGLPARMADALVALAGPATNFVLACIAAGIVRFFPGGAFAEVFTTIAYINIVLACFNLIPFPPLDGSKILTGILPFHLSLRVRKLFAPLEQGGALGLLVFLFLFYFVLSGPFSLFVQAVANWLLP